MGSLITIIICSYNGSKRLPAVFDRVFMQQGITQYLSEVIIVDNHSTDETRNIVEKYQKQMLPVPLLYVYENKPGLSNARKAGISVCNTKWIAFLDDDNLIEPNWLKNVAEYIETHPKIGVFNGAVIPHTSFKMTKNEELRLRASLKVLACTHYNLEELKKKPITTFRNPIGAGMVILTDPLKKLIQAGWINSNGRTKDDLTSGEDGEMAFYIKNQGYKFGFCSNAILFHELNRSRLTDDYLNRIWYEIGKGVAVVAKKQQRTKIQLICYRFLLLMRYYLYLIPNKYKGKYYRLYIKGFCDEI